MKTKSALSSFAAVLSLGLAFLSPLTLPQAAAQMLDFAQIQNWTGTGSNEAAMVIDWHDGKTPESLVWGFRFDDPNTTGLDMIHAIDAADPRLAVFYAYGGGFIYGIGYDLNDNGGTFTPGMPANSPDDTSSEDGSASDPGDHYAEGSFTKFWGYFVAEGSPYDGGGTWSMPTDYGAGGRTLSNGSWDGYSLSYDESGFTAPDPGFPTPADAVPEPSTWALAVLGLAAGGGLALRRRVA